MGGGKLTFGIILLLLACEAGVLVGVAAILVEVLVCTPGGGILKSIKLGIPPAVIVNVGMAVGEEKGTCPVGKLGCDTFIPGGDCIPTLC